MTSTLVKMAADGHENLCLNKSVNSSQNLAETLINRVENGSLNVCDGSAAQNGSGEWQLDRQDEILKFLDEVRAAIAISSTEAIVTKLAQESSTKLNKRSDKIIEYCKCKIP